MKWRAVALVVLLVAIVAAGEIVLGANVARVHREADGHRTALAATRAELSSVEATAGERSRFLDETNGDIAARTAEAQRARVSWADSKKFLAAALRDREVAQGQSAAARAEIGALRSCVDATGKASTEHEAHNPAAATTTLRGAQGICELWMHVGDPAPPVYPFDFADPSVLRVGSMYYAYSTNAALGNMQVLASTDLEHWLIVGDALPALPSWAVAGSTWAPAVVRLGGQYVAYYTVHAAAHNRQCISFAVAPEPTGPFVDTSTQPFICQHDRNGSIDPRPFVDKTGHPWLVWKSENLGGRIPAAIWSQPLAPDGRSLTGTPTLLLQSDRSWERGVIEAPMLVDADGVLALFYSGSQWNSDRYAIGEAHCASPAGPCTKLASPVFTTHGSIAGPGSPDFFTSPTGELWMAYAAYRAPDVGFPASRLLHVERMHLTPFGLASGAH